MDTLGKMIHEKKTKKGEDFKKMAKAIGCSERFAKHIIQSRTTVVSERLVSAIVKHYKIPRKAIQGPLKRRNSLGKKAIKEWRDNAAA